MTSITLAVDDELKSRMSKFRWVNWSELIRERLRERERQQEWLLQKLNSKEEQDMIKWSVELGRKAKKDSFKILVSELSPKQRKEVLNAIPTDKRQEYAS